MKPELIELTGEERKAIECLTRKVWEMAVDAGFCNQIADKSSAAYASALLEPYHKKRLT